MKKALYYLSPFVLIPTVLLALALLSDILPSKGIMPYLLHAALIVVPAGIGLFSPSRRTPDLPIALLCAAAFLLTMFFVNFLDAGETYSRFDFSHTLRVLSRADYLILYAITAGSALLASFKPIRLCPKKGGDRA